MSATSWRLGCALLAAGLVPLTAPAQLPVARMDHLFPPGGPRGGTTEVTVAGADLDEPIRLQFSHPGLTATPLGGGARFSVVIGTNVPPGLYEARFVGRFGLSNPRVFAVGTGPERLAPSTNTTAASASDLAPGDTVSGRVAANAIAWYRFRAKAGQRLFLECLAEELDSRMDATVILADVGGQELARNRHGGFLDFTAPSNGTWLVGVADFLYRGGAEYPYRLTLSSAPRVDYVFPPAVAPGATTNVTVYGRNLPGGRPAKVRLPDGTALEQLSVRVTAPADGARLETSRIVRSGEATLDGFEERVTGPQGVSHPFLLGFATAPVVLEAATNGPSGPPQRVTPPCEIAGQFFPAGDVDVFMFDAKKGDVWWIEVVSARLGLSTDPMVLVERLTRDERGAEKAVEVLELQDSETNVGDREFNTTSRDPAGRFEAPETGLYRVTVRDLFGGTTANPRHVYRLAVRRPAPDFRLVAMTLVPKAKADAKNIDLGVPLLRRGDAIPVRVLALRKDGFSGPIELSVESPPPGFLFPGHRIEAGKNAQGIVLASATNAPFHAGPVRLVGRARVGDRELVREVRGGTLIFSVATTDTERPEGRLARSYALGLTDRELAPVTVAPATNRIWEARAGGKVAVPYTVTRRGEFNATFKLKPTGPGEAGALKEIEVDAKATNFTLTLDLAALKLGEGSHTFTLEGSTAGKYRNNPEGAAQAEAAVKEADQRIAQAEATLKKAGPSLEQAAKDATAAEGAAKTAADKAAEVRRQAGQAPADEALKTALSVAEAAAKEATAKSTAATAAKVAAEKARAGAESAVKAAKDAKTAAAAKAKEMTDRAKPRDVTVPLYAQPIRVRVLPPEKPAK